MSLGTSNRDGGKTSESGHLRAIAKIVNGDVMEGLAASQRAAGANMSVDVAVGDAFLRRSDGSYAHPVFNDAVYNQVISAADGSNPRRDIVVIYVDYGVTPSTAVSNNTNGVVAIKVVNGTAAGSPTDPSDAAIQSSVGSGNPWTKICRVRVPAGQTSISDALIDDLRTMITSKTNTANTLAIVDAAVTEAKLAPSSVTNSKLSTTAGEIGAAWQSYTPTLTNLAVGTGGTMTALYSKIGKLVKGRIHIDFGTGTTVTGDIIFSLPVTAATNAGTGNITPRGVAEGFSGSVLYPGLVGNASATTLSVRFYTVGGSYVNITTASATVPFTWGATSELGVEFEYEAA